VSVLWAELRRDQVAQAAADGGVVLVPVGAIEQHGPHLPVGTDTLAATEVCVRAARQLQTPRVLVLPPIAWGLSPYWMGFAGTVTLRPTVLLDLVADISASVAQHGFRQLIVVNGHGGNDGLLQGAVAQASTPTFRVTVVSYWNLAREALHANTQFDGGSIGHAGEAETSIALYLNPDGVDLAAIAEDQCVAIPIPRRSVAVSASVYEAPNPEGDAPHGVYGRATAGSAEKGRRIVEAAAAGLVELIRSMCDGGRS
jgi:creatinine amidohydrolase